MPNFKVSILIPAFNAEKYIAETIQSALNQTWKSIEIIVVDDGSTDNTLQIAKAFKNQEVKVISQSNKGASAARNVAFSLAQGDYIQYLDADDLLAPDKIKQQISLVNQYGDDYVYSSAWGIFYQGINEVNWIQNELWKNFDNPANWLITAWSQQIWMPLHAWLTPRKLVELTGAWNESLSLHDDGEYFCRVLLKSKGIRFCSEAKSYYRKGLVNSLSKQRTKKAIQSHFAICQLYEEYLLSIEATFRAKQACATNYWHFHYNHYPFYKGYRKQAVTSAKMLGDFQVQPNGTELFQLLKPIIKWKLARRFERFYYGNGLNFSSIKKKLKNISVGSSII